MIKLVIVGFGNVGQGLVELLLEKKNVIGKIIGPVKVIAIADSKSSISGNFSLKEALEIKKRRGRLPENRLAREVVEEEDYDVLVETSITKIDDGGEGLKYVRTALKRGSHVVTSNKGPLVVAFRELMKLAEKNNVKLMYEATVGGAMPVIKLAKKYLAFCDILSIKGILNGTCNYILSRMEEERMPYGQVLKEAQELGIAEADPSYDVEGIDAAAKLVILANTIYNLNAKLSDVERVGITKVSPEAFDVAIEKNYTIRLIAEASRETLKVTPRLVPLNHPLAIRGTLNAAMFRTDTAGDIVVMGRGAGKMETATAVLSDILDIYDSSS
ncbi:MAG: homoserine dehydrogenase [Candidatus Methanomethylicota archaeon]|uniref:Homoserine dehydrogenase n=1 Tax=Thermoproteota archaeon TaxID=2056631 RepID=A0A497EKR0_9CREN|nr:MAG: homoserine dehydrogenase [Candidatus Verstraetearchaeota archaeon]